MRAMILAAGLGSRLGTITQTTPKCLVRAGGKPMLEYTIRRLADHGVREMVVNLHHLAPQVEAFLDARSLAHPELVIHRSHESSLLDTGGGVLAARKWLAQDNEPFFIHNADVYLDTDLSSLVTRLNSEIWASLLVVEQESSRGLLVNSANQLCGWVLKGQRVVVRESSNLRLVNFCGVHCCTRGVFEWMGSLGPVFSIIEGYLEGLRQGHTIEVVSLPSTDSWFDVGTPERLAALERYLSLRAS